MNAKATMRAAMTRSIARPLTAGKAMASIPFIAPFDRPPIGGYAKVNIGSMLLVQPHLAEIVNWHRAGPVLALAVGVFVLLAMFFIMWLQTGPRFTVRLLLFWITAAALLMGAVVVLL
jgi:hypothetical protein